MASSRSSSHAGSRASSPGGAPLTPRSKVKALLAAVESSSDDDEPSHTRRRSSSAHSATKTSRSISPEESSEDEAAILRPRGKLAARMLAKANSPQRTSPESNTDARERVRKMLQDEAVPDKSSTPVQAMTTKTTQKSDCEEEDGGVLSGTRRSWQQRRRRRSKTPVEVEPTATRSPTRSESPMFVSPTKAASPSAQSNADLLDDDDDDLPAIHNPRFKALVAKKRQERLAREAEERRKKEARLAAQQAAAAEDGLISDSGDDSNVTDDEGGIKLTQAARPSRKASKKALEDISRETQRLTRSLQLAHEAKTKKKITKSTLFERFNFRPEGAVEEPRSSSSPASPVLALHTDTNMDTSDTPPSSPPIPDEPKEIQETRLPVAVSDTVMVSDDEGELPTLDATLEAAKEAAAGKRRQIKGKGKATDADIAEQEKPKVKRNIRVKLPPTLVNTVALDSGDDDDLAILPSRPKSKVQEILDRVPTNKAKESRPMFVQRRLANLDDPDRKGSTPNGKRGGIRPSLTTAEHQALLLQKARLQAKREREERLEKLRAKGVHIQTEEEREREREEVEDIVAAARREAEEIMQREREAAKQDKKDRKEAGEVDPLAWDDSDASDDDYQGEEEERPIELSGSEEEEEIEDEEVEEEDATKTKNTLVDDAAESATESQDDEPKEAELSDDEEAIALPRPGHRRAKKHVTVISDDEDSDHHVDSTPKAKHLFPKSPSAPNTASKTPSSVLRSATKTFIPGLPVAGPAGLGLTQIFAGTMDDSQAGPLGATPSQMAPDIDAFPDSNFSQSAQEPPEDMILDSQTPETQCAETQNGKVNLQFSQSQMHGFDSLLRETETQQSDMLEPTQDAGFQEFTPLKKRFVEPPQSTVDTVVLGDTQAIEAVSDSPLVRRAGKLRRRADVKAAAALSEEEDEDTPMIDVEYDEFGFGTTSAFNVMKDAAVEQKKAKAKAEFDKKKSKAREMVEEQAEESEDEYAGLGGVDGEDSDNESDASVQEMIDNDTKLSKEDEAKMKAFYADRERASDEKQVEKLFRDITSGMLRRKRGADYDLSDSDDGGEARRRMKRRQFAKMQKALFADERISKVAENPKTQAFLRTIEDRGEDEEMDFLFATPAPETEDTQSSSQSTDIVVPASQPQERPPAAQRRTKTSRKPTTIGDIRASLSNLLEEDFIPSTSQVVPATASDASDAEDEDEDDDPPTTADKENTHPNIVAGGSTNPRRSGARPQVIDRISLKRNSSSNLSTSSTTSSTGRQAFATATASSSSSFKVPALLRKATTNASSFSGTAPSLSKNGDGGGGGGAGGFGEESKIRRNAGKKSGINYFARENERRAALAESEKRREARKVRGAEGRSEVVRGLFGGGKFE